MSSAEILAYLLLAIRYDATPQDIEMWCRVLREEGGIHAVQMRLIHFVFKYLPREFANLLAKAELKCVAGSGCCDEREIDDVPTNAGPTSETVQVPAPVAADHLTNDDIAAWLNDVLERTEPAKRLPKVAKLPMRAALIDPHSWADNLAPRIAELLVGRRRDSINVVRTMLRRAIQEGLLSQSSQLRHLIDILERWDPMRNRTR